MGFTPRPGGSFHLTTPRPTRSLGSSTQVMQVHVKKAMFHSDSFKQINEQQAGIARAQTCVQGLGGGGRNDPTSVFKTGTTFRFLHRNTMLLSHVAKASLAPREQLFLRRSTVRKFLYKI